ncbi:hypothetical protein [Jeongeupia chitinilytica]|uniref:hypothetical protein n=1 Tax=Jeongeupia chitinilytica TaxID=1041641 RepID=UPI00167AC727|nr:hypothetical protein [Jeongeupia chitinilytica]
MADSEGHWPIAVRQFTGDAIGHCAMPRIARPFAIALVQSAPDAVMTDAPATGLCIPGDTTRSWTGVKIGMRVSGRMNAQHAASCNVPR